MWFVIHVKPGAEAQAVGLLKGSAGYGALDEAFCPMSACAQRGNETLAAARRPMLDGCVFAVAPSKWELRACMRRADGLEALYDGHPSFDALEDGEAEFIDALACGCDRTVAASEGVVDGGRIRVTGGPLLGRERDIRRYSHRRRWAYLDASVAGRPASARVGLRVTREEQRAGSRFSR